MNTIILSCTQEDVYKYLYSDEGREGSRNTCPKTLRHLTPPMCVYLSCERDDGLHYHLETDYRFNSPSPDLCPMCKTILWEEFKTLGYAERFHIDATRNKFHKNDYESLIFPEGDNMT